MQLDQGRARRPHRPIHRRQPKICLRLLWIGFEQALSKGRCAYRAIRALCHYLKLCDPQVMRDAVGYLLFPGQDQQKPLLPAFQDGLPGFDKRFTGNAIQDRQRIIQN